MLLLFSVLIPSLLSYECEWNCDGGDGDGGILDIERQSYCFSVTLLEYDGLYILTVLLSSLNQYLFSFFFWNVEKQEARSYWNI